MAKATNANSAIRSAVASLAAAPVGTPIDIPIDTSVVTATDSAVDAALVTATGAPISGPVVLLKVRVLVHCGYGKPDDVIQLDPALVETLDGVVDASPAAVAYAEALARN